MNVHDDFNSFCLEKNYRRIIRHDPRFIPFRFLLKNKSLFKFIYHEKCRFIGQITETRIAYIVESETGRKKTVSGYQSESYYSHLLNIYEKEIITLSALSLSSFRTLLIALPQPGGFFEPITIFQIIDIQTFR